MVTEEEIRGNGRGLRDGVGREEGRCEERDVKGRSGRRLVVKMRIVTGYEEGEGGILVHCSVYTPLRV